MRAEKFSFLLVCALVIELFIVALIFGGLFLGASCSANVPVFRHPYIVNRKWALAFEKILYFL